MTDEVPFRQGLASCQGRRFVVPGHGAVTKKNSLLEIQTPRLSAGCLVAEESG